MTAPSASDDPAAADIDAALARARMLFSLLSAPALRAEIGRRLAGGAAGGDDVPPQVSGPLSQLAWLGEDGSVDLEALRSTTAALTALRAEGAAMHAAPVRDLPSTESERRQLAERIVQMVWERLGSPRSVSEPELNAAISMLAVDPALIRRAAVDAGALLRSDDGSRYSLE